MSLPPGAVPPGYYPPGYFPPGALPLGPPGHIPGQHMPGTLIPNRAPSPYASWSSPTVSADPLTTPAVDGICRLKDPVERLVRLLVEVPPPRSALERKQRAQWLASKVPELSASFRSFSVAGDVIPVDAKVVTEWFADQARATGVPTNSSQRWARGSNRRNGFGPNESTYRFEGSHLAGTTSGSRCEAALHVFTDGRYVVEDAAWTQSGSTPRDGFSASFQPLTPRILVSMVELLAQEDDSVVRTP